MAPLASRVIPPVWMRLWNASGIFLVVWISLVSYPFQVGG